MAVTMEGADHIAQTMSNGDIDKPHAIAVERRVEVPAYIKSLSPEQRAAAEKALVRKIDLRLIPMIVIIYIVRSFRFLLGLQTS